MASSVGNFPLHGMKLLVRIATSRSLLESMMRHPVTPAALQPSPMHMVNACFPQARQDWKHLSKLKAIRGRKPASSSRVNNGKKMAMGGSMTEVTLATVVYTPSIRIPETHPGRCAHRGILHNHISSQSNSDANHSEGRLAPFTVIHSVRARNRRATGMAVQRPMTNRSKRAYLSWNPDFLGALRS